MRRQRKKKIRRNDPCQCGSGRKYKFCHGAPDNKRQKHIPIHIPPEVEKMIERQKAKELLRENLQGLGKPIISAKQNGYQYIAVGDKTHYGKWITFFDFLGNYIRQLFGSEWGNSEIKKPLQDRHPILRWYDSNCKYQQTMQMEKGKVNSADMTGAIFTFYGLAYNLYLLAHNVELQNRLILRLKHIDQFYGAYYETFVAAYFILAGYDISLEDETNPESSHCEFTATSKITGKQYSVEAKSRTPDKPHLDIGTQLFKALSKDANHTRIVFIDVNVSSERLDSQDKLLDGLLPKLQDREDTLTIQGQDAPPAYVLITNNPSHLNIEGMKSAQSAMAEGFKIPDFGPSSKFSSLIEQYQAEQKHADIFTLLNAIRNYSIPATFDGEVAEFAFGEAERRWLIGEKYDLSEQEPNAVGILTSATVSEKKKIVHLFFQLEDGRNVMSTAGITDKELAAYKKHPETFFGVFTQSRRNLDDPLDAFEFFLDGFKDTPRDKMLAFFRSSNNYDKLAKLSDEELRFKFCEQHVGIVQRKFGTKEPTGENKSP